ncbi:MAG: Nif3-like dinuclear metal center hexameric protein [Verrucomicrobia bacterium]|nr:Nif3-like dinuclear metal center hexameric protein [Verrucomicrobiota bacterium]MBU1734468.1 Nif3-like dinuclear metal center hexameric protein [Verrucomicrobiota bacterium]MBU1856068.1 Nif3-like dinuclear metal center hexameric protein [Verrucomicrobiota bacterium]
MKSLETIVSFLDRELDIKAFADASHNGLQVENSGKIARISVGVDATLAFFEAAARRKAQMVICHHGLSWGDSLKRISGLNYRRLKFLLDHDMALYACHLPLDAHPRLGNNAQIAKALGLRRLKPFGIYHGIPIGFCGALPEAMPYTAFKARVQRVMGNTVGTMDFGKRRVRTVAIVSGGADAEQIDEAGQKGMDVYISGEPKLAAYHLAQEHKINAVFSGHYATEVFGVKALARLLSARFGLQAEFIDMGIRF